MSASLPKITPGHCAATCCFLSSACCLPLPFHAEQYLSVSLPKITPGHCAATCCFLSSACCLPLPFHAEQFLSVSLPKITPGHCAATCCFLSSACCLPLPFPRGAIFVRFPPKNSSRALQYYRLRKNAATKPRAKVRAETSTAGSETAETPIPIKTATGDAITSPKIPE